MMGLFDNIALGFSVALTLENLIYCFVGVTLGTLIGVLPGIAPVATIAMLLPVTYGLEPIGALIMLAGIYYGAQYGCSTTAILLNLPGEASAVVTCIDGHQMARQGRAGPALTIAALGSLFAGCVGTLMIALFAVPLTAFAFKFGPAEYFSLMVLGLIAASVLSGGSFLKSIAMILLGLLLGLVGMDVNSGTFRYTFGVLDLADGIAFVAIAMGIFAFAEIAGNIERETEHTVAPEKIHSLMPTRADFKASWKPVLRGTALGSFFGILPGTGATISSFCSYALEKRIADDKSRFGKGAIEGVAGPESANNAAAQTSFIPLLTLGIPPNAIMALLIGAMMIHGIIPGPQVMTENPDLFWGIIASMWIGNVMLVVLNLPMIGIWVKLLQIRYQLLYPAILMFSCIGVFSLNYATFDVIVTVAFGFLGYFFAKTRCEPAPFVLGFILGPMLEENLRRAMLLSRGDPTVFFTRPISLTFLLVVVALLLLAIVPMFRKTRVQFKDD